MPDNVGYTPGAGASVAADDIGGVLHQRVKVVIGADGTNDGDVSSANPLPVSLPATAATAAKQDTGNTSLSSIDGKTPALGQALAAASTPVVLTAAQVTTLTPPAAITGYALEAGNLASIKAKTDNLDVLLSTRLKPADTLTGVTTVAAVTAITNALPTGSNIIGKVGIDQTTAGTTNGVVLNSGVLTAITQALPAGSNLIGSVAIDSGTATVSGDVGITGVTADKQGALTVNSPGLEKLISLQTQMLQEMKAMRLMWESMAGQRVQAEDIDTPWAH